MEVVCLTAQQVVKARPGGQDGVLVAAPTRAEVAELVVRECTAAGVECSLDLAFEFIHVIEQAIEGCRTTGDQYLFSQRQLDRVHTVMDVVMPDDTPALDGSAHAAVQRFVLAGDEVALTHTKTTRFHAVYCSVRLDVLRVG
jgi:hypothetical protein